MFSRLRASQDSIRRLSKLAFALSGMAALSYEVIWTRELSLVFGSTVYAVSLMLMAFMTGLSIGSFLGGRWTDHDADHLLLFAKLEFGVACFALLTIPLIRALPHSYFYLNYLLHPNLPTLIGLQFVFSFLLMLGPTILMGATFPVVSAINTTSLKSIGSDVGTVYSANTLGSIMGSGAAGFLLIPLIGVRGTTLVAAALNIVVAAMMLAVSRSPRLRPDFIPGAAALLAVLGIGLLTHTSGYALGFDAHFLSDYGMLKQAERYSIPIYEREDVNGEVTVVQLPGGRQLVNGGCVEGSSFSVDQHTTRLLAALPIETAGDPRSMLIVGQGTGFTAVTALESPLRRVDTVEISRSVADASHYFVGDTLESDPRWRLHIADARNYLELTDRRWDVITSEPSWPLSTHVSHLFTREFYQLARSRLTTGGVFSQWLPQYLLTGDDYMMMYRTFHDVFENVQVYNVDPDVGAGGDIVMIGVNGRARIDQTHVIDRARSRHAGLDDAAIVELKTTKTVSKALSDPKIPLNTDDRPLLEFHAVRNMLRLVNAR